MEVLEDTLIVFRIPAWRGSSRASLVAHPRLYLFDLGVRNALLRRPLDRPLDDERGLLFEHLIAYELHRRMGTLWPELQIFHFRTRHGVEVDFIARVGREVWAIEVKAARDISPQALSGMRSVGDHLELARRIVVYLGPRRRVVDGIELLPLETFLAELPT